MKKRYLLLCVFAIIIGACESLDEESLTKVSTDNFYNNEEDALSALTGAYSGLKSSNGYYKQAFLSVLFASSDQGISTFLLKEFKIGTVVNTNTSITTIWKAMYIAIRDANNVIANVQSIDMDETLKSRIIGEARFLRALHYFNLVRCFGEVPLRIKPLEPGDD